MCADLSQSSATRKPCDRLERSAECGLNGCFTRGGRPRDNWSEPTA